MRADLDAALDGCSAAGADAVVVATRTTTGATSMPRPAAGSSLVIGSPAPGSMIQGIDADFDAALFVGYHARPGRCGRPRPHLDYRFPPPGRRRSRPASSASTRSRRVLRRARRLRVRRRQGGRRGRGRSARHRHHGGQDGDHAAGRRPVLPHGPRARVFATTSSGPGAPSAGRRRSAWNGEPLRLTFTRVEFCDRAAGCPGVRRVGRAHARDPRRGLRGGLPRSPRLRAALGIGGLSQGTRRGRPGVAAPTGEELERMTGLEPAIFSLGS